jgi:hypothetical protein
MTTTTEKKPIKKPATTFESTTTPVAPIAPSKTTEILDTYFDDDFQTLHKQQHAIDPSLLHKPFHIHIVNHTHAHDDHEDHDKHDVDHAGKFYNKNFSKDTVKSGQIGSDLIRSDRI